MNGVNTEQTCWAMRAERFMEHLVDRCRGGGGVEEGAIDSTEHPGQCSVTETRPITKPDGAAGQS